MNAVIGMAIILLLFAVPVHAYEWDNPYSKGNGDSIPMRSGHMMCPLGWIFFSNKTVKLYGVNDCRKYVKSRVLKDLNQLDLSDQAELPSRGKKF